MISRNTWVSIHHLPQAVGRLDHLPLLQAHVGQPGQLLTVLGGQVDGQQAVLLGPLYLPLLPRTK